MSVVLLVHLPRHVYILCEMLQVLNYGIGGHYETHCDFATVSVEGTNIYYFHYCSHYFLLI